MLVTVFSDFSCVHCKNEDVNDFYHLSSNARLFVRVKFLDFIVAHYLTATSCYGTLRILTNTEIESSIHQITVSCQASNALWTLKFFRFTFQNFPLGNCPFLFIPLSVCGYRVVEYAWRLTARVIKDDEAVWVHLRKVFKSAPPSPPRGVPRMHKLRAPLVEAQGYQRFPLSEPVVGRNVALHAVPAYRASTYLISAFPGFPAHSI